MKKIRLELKPHVQSKTIILYDSPEALYLNLESFNEVDSIGTIPVKINAGEFIEAEWRGCEFVKDGDDWIRFDSIRMAKNTPTKNSSGSLVSIYFGWVNANILSFNDKEDADSYTIRLLSPADWKMDLALLFMDDKQDENEKLFPILMI
jgi:hypothetical protein